MVLDVRCTSAARRVEYVGVLHRRLVEESLLISLKGQCGNRKKVALKDVVTNATDEAISYQLFG